MEDGWSVWDKYKTQNLKQIELYELIMSLSKYIEDSQSIYRVCVCVCVCAHAYQHLQTRSAARKIESLSLHEVQ